MLAGFLDLGGLPVPVIDLPRLLGLRGEARVPEDENPYRHLVLAADGAAAFLVDRVDDLVRVGDEAVHPISQTSTLNGCVVAELSRQDRLVPILAVPRILTLEERDRLAALAAREADRLAAFPAA